MMSQLEVLLREIHRLSSPAIACEATNHAECVQRFVAEKRAEIGVKISAGRWDNLRRYLRVVTETVGDEVGFSSESLVRIAGAIHVRVQAGACSELYARDMLAAVRQLVTWSYQRELIDALPRSWSALSSRAAYPEPRIWSVAQLQQLLRVAPPRLKACVLLGLNCGFSSIDCAGLVTEEVAWEAPVLRITRKRSKTRHWSSTPRVSWPLWGSTGYSLRKVAHRSPGECCLRTRCGRPLVIRQVTERGTIQRVDRIGQQFRRLREATDPKWPSLRALRATSATMLASGPYEAVVPYFLGHAARTVAARHYVIPDQKTFDSAIVWLGHRLHVDE